MIVISISFVVITTAVFCIYPFLKQPDAVHLEGVYIRYSEHGFGKEWDTLAIRKIEAPASRYIITRRWNYERILDGQVLAPEYKKRASSASYLDNEALLVDEESGIRYSFNSNRNELMAGTTIYKKLK